MFLWSDLLSIIEVIFFGIVYLYQLKIFILYLKDKISLFIIFKILNLKILKRVLWNIAVYLLSIRCYCLI